MTRWALENSRFTYVAVILLTLAGIVAYITMPRAEDPAYEVRKARVTTFYPGASPEQVEHLVTDPLEKAIQEIPQLDFVASESYTGVSKIDVIIDDKYRNMRPIWDDLRRKVDRARILLPAGVIGPFVDDEFGDVYGTLVAITGEGYTYAELKDIADLARTELLRLPDVSKVQITGVQEERVFVDYNPARLAEIGLSAGQLQQILAQTNIIMPGGHVSNSLERITVETTGNFETLDDLKNTVINIPGSKQVVYLKDIATVSTGYVDPPDQLVRYNGQPALVLAISMKAGGNIVNLGEQVTEVLDQIQATYPVGLEFNIAAFQTEVVEKIIHDFTINLLQSVGIVILVMLLSLGLRQGLMVATLIPTVIFTTFVIMSAWGITLDQISLAALVISLGLLVDNAICVNESVVMEVRDGLSPKEAALRTCHELSRPLLIASLTTIAAFLPIYLAQSSAGEYTEAIFQVVLIALMASWLLSMTMVPLLASQFVRVPKEVKKSYIERLIPPYTKGLHWCLAHRWITSGVALAAIILGVFGFKLVPNIFFPSNERPMFYIEIELPASVKIETTAAIATAFEQKLTTFHDVEDFTTYIGVGAPRFILSFSPEGLRHEYAFILVNATTNEAANRIIAEMRQWSDETFLDANITYRRLDYGPLVQHPVEVRISGREYEELMQIASQVKQDVASIPGAINVSDEWGRPVKKLQVNVDQAAALRAGVTSQDVANSLQTYLTGIETTEFRRQEDVIPTLLRSEQPSRESAENLMGLSVFSQANNNVVVPLSQVASVEVVWQPPKIFRRNTLRMVKVYADLAPGYVVDEVLKPLIPMLDRQAAGWPPGYFYEIGGENEESAKASASITREIPIAILVILLLLMAQFNSVRCTLIVLITIPLGFIGVVIGLLLTRNTLGFVTFLGIVSLSGIVINNAIVLIDRIRLELSLGKSPYDAIILSGQRRLIPILLTTATTIGGMIPLITGGGPMFSPLAVAIVFGLLSATTLALFVVPTLYAAWYKVSSDQDATRHEEGA